VRQCDRRYRPRSRRSIPNRSVVVKTKDYLAVLEDDSIHVGSVDVVVVVVVVAVVVVVRRVLVEACLDDDPSLQVSLPIKSSWYENSWQYYPCWCRNHGSVWQNLQTLRMHRNGRWMMLGKNFRRCLVFYYSSDL